MEAMATAQQILISSTTYELTRDMTDVKFRRLGEFTLKGVGTVPLWEADWNGLGPRPTAELPVTPLQSKRRIRLGAGAARRFVAEWLPPLKRSWSTLSQAAACLAAVAYTLLSPPPVWITGESSGVWRRLGNFIIVIALGLAFVAAQKWKSKQHLKWWAVIAVLFLLASLASFFWYQHLMFYETCDYNSTRVVIGTAYTPHGKEYHRENPSLRCQELLLDFTGNADDIWTEDSIDRNRMLLAGSYLLALPLSAVCMIAIVQAVLLA